MSRETHLWLVPSPQDAARLQAVIERCATALGSPVFPPHITLCSASAGARLPGLESIPELPRVLDFDALAYGEDFHQGCYLQVSEATHVLHLQARCAVAVHGVSDAKYPPHLSLAYGAFNAEQREAARALLPPLPLEACFDRLELWETHGSVDTWRKVE